VRQVEILTADIDIEPEPPTPVGVDEETIRNVTQAVQDARLSPRARKSMLAALEGDYNARPERLSETDIQSVRKMLGISLLPVIPVTPGHEHGTRAPICSTRRKEPKTIKSRSWAYSRISWKCLDCEETSPRSLRDIHGVDVPCVPLGWVRVEDEEREIYEQSHSSPDTIVGERCVHGCLPRKGDTPIELYTDRESDTFALVTAPMGAVQKPSRKGKRAGNLGPTVPMPNRRTWRETR
jgi:hypothetical protein